MHFFRENNLSDIITLKKGRLEDINLDENKVDAIVSEWMGYFLLFEGMLDTVIYARDNYLTPGGILLPNRCTLSIVGSGDTSTYFLNNGIIVFNTNISILTNLTDFINFCRKIC